MAPKRKLRSLAEEKERGVDSSSLPLTSVDGGEGVGAATATVAKHASKKSKGKQVTHSLKNGVYPR